MRPAGFAAATTILLAACALRPVEACAQVAPVAYAGGVQPVMDDRLYAHALLEQFEGRAAGAGQDFRYDGQGWYGGDTNKLWLKSEGRVSRGRFGDSDHELLYDRAISSYFDLQSGLRVDLDSGPTRTWAAFGVQGLAMYFFDVEATAYVGERGRAAARLKASTDLLLTNRLILQPEAEVNFYSKADAARDVGSGLSDIDAGLRLRYEWSRKFAPYVGVTYTGAFGQARRFTRASGGLAQDTRFAFGVRAWF